MKCYKGLALCYSKLKLYKVAKFYYTKQLQAAWILKNVNAEMSAYENIGM